MPAASLSGHRRRSARTTIAAAALLVVLVPVAASGSAPFERVDAVTLEGGESNLRSAVTDGTFAYFGTGTSPGQVVKVRLADMKRVGSVTLETDENDLRSAVIHPDGTHAYFGTYTAPGRVVKVDLATMQRVGAVTLGTSEINLSSAVIDPDGAYAYFGTQNFADRDRVVKVRLDGATCSSDTCGGMERVDHATLASNESILSSAVIGPDGTHAYFGTYTFPGRVVKVRLADMKRVGVVQLNSGEDRLLSAVSDGTHAYFGTENDHVVKVRLDGATCSPDTCGGMERVGAVTLNSDEATLDSAVIGPAGTHAYFGTLTSPGRVVKVDLATMTRVGAVTLESGEDRLSSAVSDGTHAYFGTETSRGRVVRVRIAEDPPPPLITSEPASGPVPPSVACVPGVVSVGATVACTVTGGDAGIDILWRAAYNPVIAEAGVTLDDAGSGEFSFVVPAAALGEELTVELVEWTAPMSLGLVAPPVPSGVPAGEGTPAQPLWALLMALAVALALIRLPEGVRGRRGA